MICIICRKLIQEGCDIRVFFFWKLSLYNAFFCGISVWQIIQSQLYEKPVLVIGNVFLSEFIKPVPEAFMFCQQLIQR